MNTLTYKGYTAAVAFDSDDNIFVGHLIGIRDIVGFHGESVSELRSAFQEAVDFYLESCSKANRAPNEPFSGRLLVKVDALLHEQITTAAVRAGKSLNKWVADTLAQAVQPCPH